MSLINKIRNRGKRLPPPKRKSTRKAEPPKVNRIKRDAKVVVDTAAKAGRHQRRVTLNLLRHSVVAPRKLRSAIDRLAAMDWNLKALKKKDTEIIFGGVNNAVADEALDEFVADLETIRDLKRHPRAGNTDNRCELCGHHHIRWEFDLRNISGGKDTKTGSTCIRTYGLNVDGYGTQEAALEALTLAIAKAQRTADREEWQEAHPQHVAELDELAEGIKFLDINRRLNPYQLYSHVEPGWKVRVKEVLQTSRVVLKYYRENQYLTKHKSEQLYGTSGSTGCLKAIKAMRSEFKKAQKAYSNNQTAADRNRNSERSTNSKFWRDLITKYASVMSWQQKNAAEHCARIGIHHSRIYGRFAIMLTPYVKKEA